MYLCCPTLSKPRQTYSNRKKGNRSRAVPDTEMLLNTELTVISPPTDQETSSRSAIVKSELKCVSDSLCEWGRRQAQRCSLLSFSHSCFCATRQLVPIPPPALPTPHPVCAFLLHLFLSVFFSFCFDRLLSILAYILLTQLKSQSDNVFTLVSVFV